MPTSRKFQNFLEVGISTVESYPGRFNVFPNPANNSLHLNFSLEEMANTNFKIVNTLGQTVLSEQQGRLSTGFHQFNFDLSGLTKGIYFLVLESEQGIFTSPSSPNPGKYLQQYQKLMCRNNK